MAPRKRAFNLLSITLKTRDMFTTAEIESIHFTADEKLVDFIQNKVTQLNKIFKRIDNCKVILRIEPDKNKQDKMVEITVNVPNKILFSENHAETFELATDMVISELKKQLRKYKEKLSEHSNIQITD
jgi:putative sigma-54 modulation protein